MCGFVLWILAQTDVSFEEKLLATIAEGTHIDDRCIFFSPTGRGVVHLVVTNQWDYVVVDGKKGEDFITIEFPGAGEGLGGRCYPVTRLPTDTGSNARSPYLADGRALFYRGSGHTSGTFFIRDGKAMRLPFESEPYVNGDASSFAYVSVKADLKTVIVDGQEIGSFSAVVPIGFRPGTRDFCFSATQGEESFLSVGARRIPHEVDFKKPRFTADGKRVITIGGVLSDLFDLETGRVLKRATSRDENGDGLSVFTKDGKCIASIGGGRRPNSRTPGMARMWMVVDGEEGEDFDWVGRPELTPGGVVAYTARNDDKWFIVVGREKIDASFEPQRLVLAGKDRLVAYSGRKENESFVDVDGELQGPYDRVGQMGVAPDGRLLFYAASKGDSNLVFVGGRRYEALGGPIEPIRFLKDGTTPFFRAKKGGTTPDGRARRVWGATYVVIGDKVCGPCADTTGPIVSSDGTMAFCAVRSDRSTVAVVDGIEHEPFDKIREFGFTPDGKSVKYVGVVQKGHERTESLVIDGKRVAESQTIGHLSFGPDGRTPRFAWFRPHASGFWGLYWKDGDRECGPYSDIREAIPTPDGRRVALIARRGLSPRTKSTRVVIDGVEGEEFLDVKNVRWSPTGDAVFCEAETEKGWVAVFGKNASEPLDHVAAPVFSADGKRAAFGARLGRELWWKVLDLK